ENLILFLERFNDKQKFGAYPSAKRQTHATLLTCQTQRVLLGVLRNIRRGKRLYRLGPLGDRSETRNRRCMESVLPWALWIRRDFDPDHNPGTSPRSLRTRSEFQRSDDGVH